MVWQNPGSTQVLCIIPWKMGSTQGGVKENGHSAIKRELLENKDISLQILCSYDWKVKEFCTKYIYYDIVRGGKKQEGIESLRH